MSKYLTALAAAVDLVKTMPRAVARMIELSLAPNVSTHERVKTFQLLYGQPVPLQPVMLNKADLYRRLHFILSEYAEVLKASGGCFSYDSYEDGKRVVRLVHAKDLNIQLDPDHPFDTIEVLDGLGDIVYVCHGMAIEMGHNLDPVIREIHASNMTKMGADGKPIINKVNSGDRTIEGEPEGKVLKGELYTRPQIATAISYNPSV